MSAGGSGIGSYELYVSTDGGPFQLYGAAHDSIVAGNRGARMDGFLVWGLNPHGWGQQPSWGCQFLDNEIVEGNGYGHRGASFGIVSMGDSELVINVHHRFNPAHGQVWLGARLLDKDGASLSPGFYPTAASPGGLTQRPALSNFS